MRIAEDNSLVDIYTCCSHQFHPIYINPLLLLLSGVNVLNKYQLIIIHASLVLAINQTQLHQLYFCTYLPCLTHHHILVPSHPHTLTPSHSHTLTHRKVLQLTLCEDIRHTCRLLLLHQPQGILFLPPMNQGEPTQT